MQVRAEPRNHVVIHKQNILAKTASMPEHQKDELSFTSAELNKLCHHLQTDDKNARMQQTWLELVSQKLMTSCQWEIVSCDQT